MLILPPTIAHLNRFGYNKIFSLKIENGSNVKPTFDACHQV